MNPTAGMTEALDTLPDGADEATFERAVLEVVVVAETQCHSDWSLIQALTAEYPDGEIRTASSRPSTRSGSRRSEHIRWARENRAEDDPPPGEEHAGQMGMAIAETAVHAVKEKLS